MARGGDRMLVEAELTMVRASPSSILGGSQLGGPWVKNSAELSSGVKE